MILFALTGVMGGPGNAIEVAIVSGLADWRADNPDGQWMAAAFTHVGGGAVLMTIAGMGAIALLIRRRFRDLVLFLLATVGGRFIIELTKYVIERPRPAFDEHPVYTTNYSFPSGHAGNTTMTFLALAWFLSPAEHRRTNLAIGMAGALLIGLTRPVLGVHWPTDIIAGWALGIAWVGLLTRFSQPRDETAA